MKVSCVVAAALVCAAPASAQYFSEGWKPGQAATPTHETYSPDFTPAAGAGQADPQATSSPFDFSSVFTSGPIGSLLEKVGINVSAATKTLDDLWDMRIPLIHDDNYDELVVKEPLTPEEEAARVWFIVISTTNGGQQQGGISKLIDAQFDAAYNETLIEKDLPDVRWGRIDYMNVTYLTTKWNIWQGPWLLVAKDRGQSLRFYKANQVRLNSTVMRNFLKEESWVHTTPWNTAFAPGGDREFIMHYFAYGMRVFYDFVSRVPKFMLMIATGAFGSVIMRLLHRPPPEAAQPPAKAIKPKPTPSATSAPAAKASLNAPTTSSPKKSPAKGKKGGKK